MAKAQPKLPKYNAKRGAWVGGDSRTLYTFTDPTTGHRLTTHGTVMRDGTSFKHYRIAAGPDAAVRVATRTEADAAGWTQGGGGWTTLGAARGGIPTSLVRFAVKHKIGLARHVVPRVDGTSYFIYQIKDGGRVVEATRSPNPTVSQAMAMMHRYLKAKPAGLGRLGPSGAYAGKTNFQWLQRDVAGALRRRDCGAARTSVSKALLAARTPKERGAVVAMQQKVLACEIRGTGVGRSQRRR